MKKSAVLFILLLFTEITLIRAAEKRFFITTSGNNKEAEAYLGFFETTVFNELKKNFPCVEINSQSVVVTLLGWERQKQLLGTGSEDAISNIAEAMGTDYLVSLKVKVLGGSAIVDAFCADSKKAKVISRASASVPHGSAGVDAVAEVSKQLIEGLKQFEICPFTGPVSIAVNSELDSVRTVDYRVYCNEMDQQYHQELKINNSTTSDWKLERKGIARTEGNMTFYSSEESEMSEENGCYTCKSGREGGRTYTETRSVKVKGSGISHESVRDGKPQDDIRIELRFLENDSYLVIAKGTSQTVKGEEKIVSGAVGTCDNQPQETKVVPREITIPLNVIFGPYQGKSTDKVLQQEDSKETTDPSTGEKSSISINFTLKQKDK